MKLTNKIIKGINEVYVTNSLDAPLLEMKVSMLENTVPYFLNDLRIYVDKNDKENPTPERKQYIFELDTPLKRFGNVSDEFIIKMEFENEEITMKTFIKRMVGNNEVLEEPLIESLENTPIALFEGENFIYTNYENANIEIAYPEDDDLNKRVLSSLKYFTEKIDSIRNSGIEIPQCDFSLDDIYFKDAFTKTEEELNLEVDNLTAECITSKNDAFSLDDEGNLVVNTITTNTPTLGSLQEESICDLIYPVGSIYLSILDINPTTLFGGTWEAWGTGKVPVGVDVNQTEFNTVGKTGGDKKHTLSPEEMPIHSHEMYEVNPATGTGSWTPSGGNGGTYQNVLSYVTTLRQGWQGLMQMSTKGGSQAHNNLQPYITCYMWKRTA